jgi:hypothetical protein
MGLFTGLGTSIFATGNRGIYNGSVYVVTGTGLTNTVAISYTGQDWIGLGVTIFSTSGRDICYFNNRFVATGEGGNTFATSYDGLFWVGSGITMFLYGTAIANNNNIIVACGIGDYDNMAYSTDAVNWTGLGYSIFDTSANGVATDGINWVCTGQGSVNTLAFSTDAVTWNGLGTTVFDIYGTNVTWNGNLFMAVGSGSVCKVASSLDGQVWTLLTVSLSFANDIAWHEDHWIITGNSVFYSYTNGVTWVAISTAGIFSGAYGIITTTKGPYLYRSQIMIQKQLDISSESYADGYQNFTVRI